MKRQRVTRKTRLVIALLPLLIMVYQGCSPVDLEKIQAEEAARLAAEAGLVPTSPLQN